MAGRLHEVLDLDDRFVRIDDAEIEHRVHLDRDIVTRYHVLAWYVEHDSVQVHVSHLVWQGDHQDEPGYPDAGKAAKREHDGALVLTKHSHRRHQEPCQQEYDENDDGIDHDWSSLAAAAGVRSGSTASVSPLRPITRTGWPEARGASARACQRSPRTCTWPVAPDQDRTLPAAPTSAASPVTTGRRRARISRLSTRRNRLPATTVMAITTGGDS